MQTSVNSVVKNIFDRNNLQEVSEEQLREYVQAFPYSSIGHLLLAKKKKDEGDDYSQEASMAALYLNNPLWLHCFLESESITAADKITPDQQEVQQFPTSEIKETDSITIPQEIPEMATDEPVNNTLDEPEFEPTGAIEPVIENHEPVSFAEEQNTMAVIQVPEESTEKKVELFEAIQTVEEKKLGDKEPIFEPYYTVDYFASQGIKLKAGELENDKFGRQLKSFTDWLRSMKRVTPAQADDLPQQDPGTDAAILKNAEESVETSDVETEAMAEVWVKQGKTARAAAIYRKLSLLNPAKSHYFAAKIEQLND